MPDGPAVAGDAVAKSRGPTCHFARHKAALSFLPSFLPGLLAIGVGLEVAAQNFPPQTRFSTHDSTVPPLPQFGIVGLQDYQERWADVKTPGDGLAYSVGTIEVHNTLGALFSGAPVEPAGDLPTFSLAAGPVTYLPARQVVILQWADSAGPDLLFQRFYYGTNPSTPGALRSTNARGVAVWPGDTELDTRIAICGETFDEVLPLSNAADPNGWPGAGSLGSSGFIAVFDGAGTLRWSHHFFGIGDDLECVISDISIQVAEVVVEGQPTLVDLVTFCGMSSYGNPAANATLTTVKPFVAPTGPNVCANATGGDVDNGAGQWDGIVGQLSNLHSASGTPATVEYLSVLGGAEQDALFGIVDIDESRFAVVGSTGFASGSGTAAFPVTFFAGPNECPGFGTASVGVAAVLRMEPGSLVLESSQVAGSGDPGTDTCFRDVLMQRLWGSGEPSLVIAGHTDDPNLFTAGALSFFPIALGPQATFGGLSDGVVLAGSKAVGTPLITWSHGTFRGGAGLDYLTGVQGWNEYYDHFAVVGVTQGPQSEDFDVASYYRRPQFGGFPPLAQLTETTIGGDYNDRPARMGRDHAAELFDGVTGGATGGGIAVDPTSRVNVVGMSTVPQNQPVSTWPITGPMTTPPGPQGRAATGSVGDAVRVALDLLPENVGRTDGTGTVPANGLAGGYPIAGFTGGTTPECALTPFGHRIGWEDPQMPPLTPRILLDWAGDDPGPNANFTLVVSRHPQANPSAFSLLALQLGFPGWDPAGANPQFQPLVVAPAGWFLWVPNDPVTVGAPLNSAFEAIEFPLVLPPVPPAGTITLQVVCLLLQPIDGGVTVSPGSAVANCDGTVTSTFTASPALWLDF